MFEIEKVSEGEVRFSGRFDASQEENAIAALKDFKQSLTVDCAALDYVSSSGIGVIIETYKRLHAAGHTFRLVNMNPRVRNVFAYAGLDKLLQIE